MSTIPLRTARPLPDQDSGQLQGQALAAAQAGLDFLVRHQVTGPQSADHGRFPFTYDCQVNRAVTLTTNWTTGIAIEALLAGHRQFGRPEYLEAAGRAAAYLCSLQDFSPLTPRVRGVFHETTPQSNMAHPRDALTAAWALVDWSQHVGADHPASRAAFARARLYADWFIDVGMERGFPYWTVRFDAQPWNPSWCGSFHSGSAFFLWRMHELTGDDRYRRAMNAILQHYNVHHLDESGRITVIRDRQNLAALDGTLDARLSNRGWEVMHVYNDDFGALANLAAWKLERDPSYLHAARRFLQHMSTIQRDDGGFGPPEYSVPSAGGAVLLEMIAAQTLGHDWVTPRCLDHAATYLINLQVRQPGDPADGAFRGFTDQYTLNDHTANIRAGAYAIMGLLRYGGAVDPYYFFA